MASDANSRARGLSKLFKKILDRNAGDKGAAKKDMDDKFGDAWQVEIVIDDTNYDYTPDGVKLDRKDKASVEEADEMFKAAREYANTFGMDDEDLTFEPESEADDRPKESKDKKKCLSEMFREMADLLEEYED